MKQLFTILALAGLMVGCTSTEEDMGATGSDTSTIQGSETSGMATNGTSNATTNGNDAFREPSSQPENSELGNEPDGSR